MAAYFNSPKDNTHIHQIVSRHIDKILEILSKELKNKQTLIPQIGSRAEIVLEEEDTRQSFVQSVQALSYLLSPWHDKEIEKLEKEFDEITDGTNAKYLTKYQDEIKKELDLQKKLKINEHEEVGDAFSLSYRRWHKVTKGKQMFKMLNKLLYSNDYLKGSIYGEGGDGED